MSATVVFTGNRRFQHQERLMKLDQRKIANVLIVSVVACCAIAASSILSNESVGGIKISEEMKTVKERMGEPDKTKYLGFSAASGCHVFLNVYRGKGLKVFECRYEKKTAEGSVSDVSAFRCSRARTARDIGIGSTGADVKKAYGESVHCGYNRCEVVDEEVWMMLELELKKDKVTKITLGYSNMPE
jgi:hypothetical protein